MATPTLKPEWAVLDTYPDGSQNKVRPDISLRQYGYPRISAVTSEELNWQLNNLYKWIDELSSVLVNAGQTPVNQCIIIDGDNRNPAAIYGYGSWQQIGQGRVLIGAGTGTDVNGVQRSFSGGGTGGEYVHKITESEMPSHRHNLRLEYQGNNKASEGNAYCSNGEVSQRDFFGVDTRTTEATGGDQPMNLLNPFLVVYMWKRIS